MALDIGFYPAEFHNTSSVTGAIGGAINSSSVLSAGLNSFFPEGVSDYIGQSDRLRFQKIYVKKCFPLKMINYCDWYLKLKIYISVSCDAYKCLDLTKAEVFLFN